MERSQHWKAGLFVAATVVVLAVTIALVVGINLTSPRNPYTIRFDESVSGLDTGADVKYRGVQVGNVVKIRIPPDDITRVEAVVSINKDMPIKSDTRATLSTVGITGIKFIELQGGSAAAGLLPAGGRIEAEPSLMFSLTGTAQTAAEKLDVLLANLIYITDRAKVEKVTREIEEVLHAVREGMGEASDLLATTKHAAHSLDAFASRADSMLERNEAHIDSSFGRLDLVLGHLEETLAGLEEARFAANAGAAAAAARGAAEDLRGILSAHRYSISETLANLRETSSNLNDFSRLVRDKPSLLLRSSTETPAGLPGTD